MNSTDVAWEIWGQREPYFGVLTDSKYLSTNLNDATLAEFFASGERHVERVFNVVQTRLRPDFLPTQVLDYGCGTGRLVIPFCRRAHHVTGVDVSPSMLAQARENCAKFRVASAQLMHVDEMDALAPLSFELVHSYIVFQHIPVARGELIFRKLIGLIAPGGIGAFHFTYRNPLPWFRCLLSALRNRSSLFHGLLNVARRQPFSTPRMQMNNYSIERIFEILAESNCSNVFVEFSNHNGSRGAMFYFERSPNPAH